MFPQSPDCWHPAGPVPPRKVKVPLKPFSEVSLLKLCADSAAYFEGMRTVSKARSIREFEFVCVVPRIADRHAAIGKCVHHIDGRRGTLSYIAGDGVHELKAALVDHGWTDHCRFGSLHRLFASGIFVTLRWQIKAADARIVQANVGELVANHQCVFLIDTCNLASG